MKVKKVIQSCLTICDPMDCPWNSPGQNTGVGSLSLLQGIFPGIEPSSLALQADSLPAEPLGKPTNKVECNSLLLNPGEQRACDWAVTSPG